MTDATEEKKYLLMKRKNPDRWDYQQRKVPCTYERAWKSSDELAKSPGVKLIERPANRWSMLPPEYFRERRVTQSPAASANTFKSWLRTKIIGRKLLLLRRRFSNYFWACAQLSNQRDYGVHRICSACFVPWLRYMSPAEHVLVQRGNCLITCRILRWSFPLQHCWSLLGKELALRICGLHPAGMRTAGISRWACRARILWMGCSAPGAIRSHLPGSEDTSAAHIHIFIPVRLRRFQSGFRQIAFPQICIIWNRAAAGADFAHGCVSRIVAATDPRLHAKLPEWPACRRRRGIVRYRRPDKRSPRSSSARMGEPVVRPCPQADILGLEEITADLCGPDGMQILFCQSRRHVSCGWSPAPCCAGVA